MSTDQTKDLLSRWAPLFVALAGLLGQVFYFGNETGKLDARVNTNERTLAATVTRVEYLADKTATGTQLNDVKQSLRDISQKLDRVIEQQRR